MTPSVIVHPDADLLAQAIAARTVTALIDAQTARGAGGAAHLVVTGGGIGIACLAALADCPTRDAVDWTRVDVWWGDERFLPAGHPDRNVTQARSALLDHVPIPPDRIHEMPASDGEYADDVDAAAAGYARDLAAHAENGYPAPSFDVLMLGVGPDGHIASLFPDHPALQVSGLAALAVRESPKPPPVRISMSLPTINHARQVWLLAAGASKTDAVGAALFSAGPPTVPAGQARGRDGTLWLLDADALGEGRLSG